VLFCFLGIAFGVLIDIIKATNEKSWELAFVWRSGDCCCIFDFHRDNYIAKERKV
jgi:hypothetical protein